MGFAALHIQKPKGNDARTTAHIERTVQPTNADPTRTHLNRELIEFPAEVENRTQAIQYRIEHANIKRKITDNQIRALQVMLTGTHEDMLRIQSDGKIDDWCRDNMEWLHDTFGKENVVSAVLHLDEKIPHIHATVVPIVKGERRKAKVEENNGKKKYRKKPLNAVRLCADDIMTRKNLERFQDTYAEKMAKYGLQRGIKGSEARHINTTQYYREVFLESQELQENIKVLQEQEEEAKIKTQQAEFTKAQKTEELKDTEESLHQAKGQLKTEKLKNTAADVGSTIIEGIGSMIGTSKVKLQQKEIDELKAETKHLKGKIIEQHQYIQTMQTEHETVLSKLKQELSKIYDLFPSIKELLRIENLCKVLGFSDELTKMILKGEPVGFKGKLHSPEHDREFETSYSEARVTKQPNNPSKLQLMIDGLSHTSWFQQKHQEFLKSIGINFKPRQKEGKSKGFRIF